MAVQTFFASASEWAPFSSSPYSMARRWLLAVALLRLVGGILDAEVQELSEREG